MASKMKFRNDGLAKISLNSVMTFEFVLDCLTFFVSFRGQMISQEVYNFISQFDRATPDARAKLLSDNPFQVRSSSKTLER